MLKNFFFQVKHMHKDCKSKTIFDVGLRNMSY